MIVTSFQDLKLRGKQISQSFSYCELINSSKDGTKVRFIDNHKSENLPQEHLDMGDCSFANSEIYVPCLTNPTC